METTPQTEQQDEQPAQPPRQLTFAGRCWNVVTGEGRGNHFLPANVVVDARGRLFLGIARQSGRWTAAELELAEPAGYGEYGLTLDSPPGFPANVVLSFGLAGMEWECAVQLSQWAGRPHNAQFVLQRADEAADDVLETFNIPSPVGPTRHRIQWTPERLTLGSYDGRSRFLRGPRPLHQARIEVALPADGARLRLGCWLYRGDPPADGRDQRVWVRDIQVRTGH